MYDGEGKVVWPEHLDDFHALMENVEGFNEKDVCLMLAHTLRNYSLQWCSILPLNFMDSFKQFSDLIESFFHHFDAEALDKKMLQQRKAQRESLEEFLGCFLLLIFKALKTEMKCQYHMEIFEYCLHKSIYPNEKKKFKPHLAYLDDGVA